MRAALRPATLAATARTLAGRGAGTGAGGGAVVLGYHDVRPDPTDRYDTTPARLRAQLRLLAASSTIVPFGALVDRLAAGLDVDGLSAVTFDDALDGLLDHGVGILAELAIPATVFVVSQVRGAEPRWWPGPRRTVDEAGLRALVEAGLTIGSHTRTHPDLTALDDEAIVDELEGSRADLTELVGADVDLLAYPQGRTDGRVRAAAVAAGYRGACTFVNGRTCAGSDPFAVPRLTMDTGHSRVRLAVHLARPAASWPS